MKTKEEKRNKSLEIILNTINSGKNWGGSYRRKKILEAYDLMTKIGIVGEKRFELFRNATVDYDELTYILKTY